MWLTSNYRLRQSVASPTGTVRWGTIAFLGVSGSLRGPHSPGEGPVRRHPASGDPTAHRGPLRSPYGASQQPEATGKPDRSHTWSRGHPGAPVRGRPDVGTDGTAKTGHEPAWSTGAWSSAGRLNQSRARDAGGIGQAVPRPPRASKLRDDLGPLSEELAPSSIDRDQFAGDLREPYVWVPPEEALTNHLDRCPGGQRSSRPRVRAEASQLIRVRVHRLARGRSVWCRSFASHVRHLTPL